MAYFNEKIDRKLEELGYVIVCESPLEVEYTSVDYPQDGVIGTASGVCAKELLENVIAEYQLKG